MTKLLIFCVTNKQIDFLEKLNLKLVGVGKDKFPNNYIQPVKGKNIQKKEKNYSELTFHYWLWKNKLKKIPKNTWIGFCQKRRFWIKKKQKINNYKDLQRNFDGLGIYILSTSKGVLSDSEARVESVGGEILCKIF